jgi:hypothetical protein
MSYAPKYLICTPQTTTCQPGVPETAGCSPRGVACSVSTKRDAASEPRCRPGGRCTVSTGNTLARPEISRSRLWQYGKDSAMRLPITQQSRHSCSGYPARHTVPTLAVRVCCHQLTVDSEDRRACTSVAQI